MRGGIHGFSLCRRSPSLTHLLFVEDSLLFCRSNVEECQKVLEVLQVYEMSSGQQINKAKTTVFFSKSTKEDWRESIKNTLGVTEIWHYEKYLELPSLVGRNKNSSFNYIKEHVWQKLQRWEEKLLFLSRARDINQGGCPSNPHLYHELFQAPYWPLWRDRGTYSEVLVGTKRR